MADRSRRKPSREEVPQSDRTTLFHRDSPSGAGTHPPAPPKQSVRPASGPPADANPAVGGETIMMPPPAAVPRQPSQPPPPGATGSGAYPPAASSGAYPQMPGSMPPSMPGSMPPSMPGSHPSQYPMAPGVPMMDPRWRPSLVPSFAPPQPLPQLQPPPLHLQGALDPRLVLLRDPDSARAVSFRLLRDNLVAKRLPRVVAITSPNKGDGKTTCAANLGLALAEAGRVLLVEGNFLEPALGTVFALDESTPVMPNMGWLGPYRVGELSRNLHVAAPPARTPAPRFDKIWFEQMIGAFRRFNYDAILIDAAALNAAPSVVQLVSGADGVLLAVRSGVTTARALRRATEQLPGGKAIGVALVDAKQNP